MTTHTVSRGLANVFAEPCVFANINQPQCSTQLSLNSDVQIIDRHLVDETPAFYRVVMGDTYTGWIKSCDIEPKPDRSGYSPRVVTSLFADIRSEEDSSSEVIMKVPLGTTLFLKPTSTESTQAIERSLYATLLPDGRVGYVDSSLVAELDRQVKGQTVEDVATLAKQATLTAKSLVGVPYFWGGTSSFGIDCSGLVQRSYGMHGLELLRDARLQFEDPRFERLPIESFAGPFAEGDLLFFRSPHGQNITHVGMALSDHRFVHASPYSGESQVVIEKREGNRYAYRFVAALRLKQNASMTLDRL